MAPHVAGSVHGQRLDEAVAPLDRLDLVKVDTEGADLHARWRGMTGLLAAHGPVLVVESHHMLPYGYPLSDLLDTVTGLGYRWEWGPVWPPEWEPSYLICHPWGAA